MNLFFRLRWVIVFVFFAIIAATAPFLRSALQPDNSLAIWFLSDDPNYKNYQSFHKTFGNDEVIAMVVPVPKAGPDPRFISRLDGLISKLEAVKGVQHVNSILSVQDAYDTTEGLVFEPLLPRSLWGDTGAIRDRFRSAQSNRITKQNLISADGRYLMLWVQLKTSPTFDRDRTKIVHDLSAVVQQNSIGKSVAMGGLSVVYTALNDLTQRDVAVFFTASYALIFLVLWIMFRRLPLVLGAMVIAAVGILVSLGIYGVLGYQLNMVTAMLPTVIIVIGVADIIHLPSLFRAFKNEYPLESPNDTTIRTLKAAFFPCFLTCLTNVVGFLSLALAPMTGLKQFGVFSAIGIFTSFVFTFALMAVLLPYFPPVDHTIGRSDIFSRFLDRSIRWSFLYPRTIILTFLGIIVICSIGFSRLVVDTYTLGYLPDTAKVVVDHKKIVNTWGDYMTLELTLTPRSGGITQSDIMRRTEQFARDVAALPEVRSVNALPDLYRRMEEVMTGQSSYPTPLSQQQVSQLTLILESENLEWDRDNPDYKSNFMGVYSTEDQQTGRITIVGKALSANQIDALWSKILQIGERVYQDQATIHPSGYGALYAKISRYIIQSQISSFFYTIAIIFIILFAWTRSIRLSLIGVIPNVFPVVVMMGVMGFMGIALDLGTAMVAAIILGIVTDDTVHFLHHWQSGEKKGLTWKENVEETYRYAGRAALLTSILLTAGFPVMMLSELKTVFYFGFLTTLAAGIAVFADLFMMPQLLKIGYKGRRQ